MSNSDDQTTEIVFSKKLHKCFKKYPDLSDLEKEVIGNKIDKKIASLSPEFLANKAAAFMLGQFEEKKEAQYYFNMIDYCLAEESDDSPFMRLYRSSLESLLDKQRAQGTSPDYGSSFPRYKY